MGCPGSISAAPRFFFRPSPAHVLFRLSSLSVLDDHLDMSVSLFWGCFAVFAVVAEAGGATCLPGLSAIVSGFH